MRGSLIALVLLAGFARAEDPELAFKAQNILRTYCYRCHGQEGVFEGGLNYLLDPARLIAAKKIVPGKPEESKLFQRVAKGTMPPADQTGRPSDAEKDILRQWIAAGAPAAGPAPTPRTIVSQSDLFRWMLDDLQTMDRRSRRFVRYFSLAHLYNQGLSDDEMQTYRNALSKLANSLSWHPKISVPVAVDASKILLRIDLRWFMWDANLWNRLLAEYPYGVLDDGVTSRAVMVGTATKLPVIRADWFVATASRPPLYFDMLQLPASLAELERQLRVDAAVNIQQERVVRLGFNGSGISKNNRILERHDSVHGPYWRTYDFEAVPQNLVERGGLLPDQRNVFAYPLGPAGVTPRDPFLHAGGEAIFALPNGLHGYIIYNNLGNRIDKGPVQIVSDPKRPDRAVETGVSCMGCHLTGINPKTDQVRDSLAKNPKAFSRADAELIRALYAPEERTTKLMQEDAEKYRLAVQATGAKIVKTEPVSTLTLRYEADMDLPAAAAEAGLTPDDFRQKITSSELLTRNLGALRVAGGTISRQIWVQTFGDVVRDLKLGSLFNSNVNGGGLPDNTGDLDPLEASGNQTNAAAITRDGRLALIAGGDRSLKLWDIGAEREVRRFVGHSASIWAVAFSKDERFAVSGGMDGTMRLWDVSSGQEVKRFDGHLTLVASVAISPDGSKLASGGYDGSVVIWSRDGQELKRLDTLGRYIHAVMFSPDGKHLLVASDKKLHLVNVETGEMAKAFAGHAAAVSCLAFAPDGLTAASGADDGTIRVWNLATGKWGQEFRVESKAAVRDLAFAPSGKALLTASADRLLRLWDIAGQNLAGSFDKHGEVVIHAGFVNDGKQSLSISRDSAIKGWGLTKHAHLVLAATSHGTSTPVSVVPIPGGIPLEPEAVIPIGGTIGNIVLSPNGKWLYLHNRSEAKLVLIDVKSNKVARTWNMPDGAEVFTLARDGKELHVLANQDDKTTLINLDPATLKPSARHPLNLVGYDVAGDNGRVFITGESGGWSDVAVFDLRRSQLAGRWGGVWTRSFIRCSPDGSRIYTSSQGVNPGKIEGFPIPTNLADKPTPSTAAGGGPFMLSPDGRWLIATNGATFRLSPSREEDLHPGPKLPAHLAAAVDPGRGFVVLLMPDGFTLKRYSFPSMQWQADHKLRVMAYQMAFDPVNSRVYLGVIDPASLSKQRVKGFGDLHVFSLIDPSSTNR